MLGIGAVSASTLVAGCIDGLGGGSDGGSGQSGGGNVPPDKLVTSERIGGPSAPNQMTYWLLPTASNRADDNPALAESYRKIYRKWAKDHPEYSIELEFQTNLEQMKTKLLQAAARGNAPDLVQTDSFWVPSFYDSLQPVTEVIDQPDDWYQFVKDIVVQDSEWMTVWKNTDCRALYYRQDLIDKHAGGKPPKTWDELVKVGTTIKQNEDMWGYMYNGGRWEGTTFDNLAMFWAQGGDLVDKSGKPVLGEGKNYDALLNVFEFFKRTVDSGITPTRVATITDYGLLREAALNGETAMFLGGNWQIATIKQQVDKSVWENWKVAKIPQIKPNISSTGTGGWTEGVFTDDSDLKPAATDYVGLYTDKQIMANRCKAGGYLPTRKSVFEEEAFFSENPYMQQFKQLLEHGRARPGVPIYLTISSQWQIAAGKVITGQATPKAAIDTMVDNVMSEYDG